MITDEHRPGTRAPFFVRQMRSVKKQPHPRPPPIRWAPAKWGGEPVRRAVSSSSYPVSRLAAVQGATALLLTVGLLATGATCSHAISRQPDAWKHAPRHVKSPWRALKDYPRPPAPDTGWGIHDVTDCVWTPK